MAATLNWPAARKAVVERTQCDGERGHVVSKRGNALHNSAANYRATPGAFHLATGSVPVTKPALLSIVGMVRSGSTFLEGRIADLFDGVAVGELVGSWGAFGRNDLLCSCGQTPMDCPFWAMVRRQYPGVVDADTIAFMMQTNRSIMPIRRIGRWRQILSGQALGDPRLVRYREESRRLLSAVGAAAASVGYQLVVDSSKHPVFFALANSPSYPATFSQELCARVVRDPRGVSFSLEHPKAQVTREGGEAAMKGYSRWRTLPFWLAMNEASDRVVPPTAVRLRYEDFDREMYREWLEGVGFEVCSRGRDSRHQLVANPIRQSGPAAFKLDERWHHAGGLRSTLIGTALLPWMRRYGYPVRPGG